jgi:hypothetical protein
MKLYVSELRRAGILVVVLHALVVVVHSVAHSILYIHMSLWQNIYIFLVIVVLPVVSGVLLWRRPPGASPAFILLLLSMLGSLVFGGYYHFILGGPDNVAWLTDHSWTLPFQVSAVLLALTEAAGGVVGLLGIFAKYR